MKRNEIKAGMELYYDRSNNWQEGGYGSAAKAVVADDKRYRINRQTWGIRQPSYTEDPKGTAVLIDLHRPWGTGEIRVERTAVPAAHLRGPWEQLRAEIAARRDERRQVTERARAEEDALQKRADVAKARAVSAGFKVDVSGGYGRLPYVEVSVEEFERLLSAAGVAEGNHTE